MQLIQGQPVAVGATIGHVQAARHVPVDRSCRTTEEIAALPRSIAQLGAGTVQSGCGLIGVGDLRAGARGGQLLPHLLHRGSHLRPRGSADHEQVCFRRAGGLVPTPEPQLPLHRPPAAVRTGRRDHQRAGRGPPP